MRSSPPVTFGLRRRNSPKSRSDSVFISPSSIRLPHSRLADACSPQRGRIDRPSSAAVQQNAVNRHGRHGGDAVAGCLLPAFVRSAAFPQVIDPHLTARARQGTDKTHDLRAHRTAGREDFNASLYGYHRPTSFSPPSFLKSGNDQWADLPGRRVSGPSAPGRELSSRALWLPPEPIWLPLFVAHRHSVLWN